MSDGTNKRKSAAGLLRHKGAAACHENIGIQDIPNYGIVLVATGTIKPGKRVLQGYMAGALEFRQGQETMEQPATGSLPREASIHCRFAVELTLKPIAARDYSCWDIPNIDHYKKCFPILWPEHQKTSLSDDAKIWLEDQESRLEDDWQHAKEICQLKVGWHELDKSSRSPTEDMFLRAWLYVESKAYEDTRKHDGPSPTTPGPTDQQVLFPVVDYLSMDREGCTVHVTDRLYWFTTTREYKTGEAIGLKCGYSTSDLLVTCGTIQHNGPCNAELTFSDGRMPLIEEEPSLESLAHPAN